MKDIEAYKSKLTIAPRPVEPALLRQVASKLTDYELQSIPKLKKEYEAALEANKQSLQAWREDEGRLQAEFKKDLEIDNGVVGHPKANRLYELAWEWGHSSGLSEVKLYYDQLVDLLK